MHIVKCCSAVNQTLLKMRKIVSYITDLKKCKGMVTDVGIVGDPYESMLLMKQLHGKDSGRQFIQMVFSPDPEAEMEEKELLFIVKNIVTESFPNFQALISEHLDTSHKHVHVIINSVDCYGKKFQLTKTQLKAIKDKTALLMNNLEDKDYEVLLLYDDEDSEDDEYSYLEQDFIEKTEFENISCDDLFEGFQENTKPGFIPCKGLTKGFVEGNISGFLPYQEGTFNGILDDE